jgi:hypothetical protein
MKKLLSFLFFLLCFCGNAQNKSFEASALQLTRNDASTPFWITLKKNSRITVRTVDKKKLTFLGYTFMGDSAIASLTDTVALSDITSVKGDVKGNVLRKISGIILLNAGGYFTIFGVVIGAVLLAPQGYLICVPAVGIGYIGFLLAGPRNFDTSKKWTLNLSSEPE